MNKATQMMLKNRKSPVLERIEVPTGSARVARERCRPLVQRYSELAGLGQLDLDGLAMSCYLQGLNDALQLVEHHPAIAAPLLENVRKDVDSG